MARAVIERLKQYLHFHSLKDDKMFDAWREEFVKEQLNE